MSVNRDDLVRLKSRLITEGMLLATAKKRSRRIRGARMLREAADCEETLAAMASDADKPSRRDHLSSAVSCRRMCNCSRHDRRDVNNGCAMAWHSGRR